MQDPARMVVKVVKSIKDPVTGKYTYKEMMIPQGDKVADFFAEKNSCFPS